MRICSIFSFSSKFKSNVLPIYSMYFLCLETEDRNLNGRLQMHDSYHTVAIFSLTTLQYYLNTISTQPSPTFTSSSSCSSSQKSGCINKCHACSLSVFLGEVVNTLHSPIGASSNLFTVLHPHNPNQRKPIIKQMKLST